jgi:enoyl-CoA hydratase/carnithine racemase
MDESLIKVDRRSYYSVITINRPRHGNALSFEAIRSIKQSIIDLRSDKPNPIIFTGAGEKFFCAGGDIKSYTKIDSEVELEEIFGAARDLLDLIEAYPCAVIAAINGWALGGGAELALACDFRVIEEHASVGFPQVRLGIIPGWDGMERLSRLVGFGSAKQLLLTGEPMASSDTVKTGFAHWSVPKGESLKKSAELCEALVKLPQPAFGVAKEQVLKAYSGDYTRNEARRSFARLWFSADHREAERDFSNKSLL